MPTSISRALADDLIADILAGKLKPDESIPSMRVLARHGYVGRCSGHHHGPMAIATAQRARQFVDQSGLVTPNHRHSGRLSRVLPREQWRETVSTS